MPPIYTPPGGWCLSPQSNPFGISALMLENPNAPIYTWLGGVLVTLLGPSGVSAAKIRQAMVTARTDNYPMFSSTALELIEMWTALWQPTAYVVDATLTATQATLGAVQRVITQRIPAAEQYNLGVTQDYYNQAVAHADANLNTALSTSAAGSKAVAEYATQLSASDRQLAAELYQAATTYAGQVAHSAAAAGSAQANARITLTQGWTRSLVDEAVSYVTAQANQLRAELATLEAWTATQIDRTRTLAVTGAKQAEAGAITYTNRTTEAALQPVWAGTAESANRVTKQLGAQHPATADKFSLIPTSVPTGVAAALTAVVAATKSIATATAECAQPYCTEKNRQGRTLKSLDTLLLGGAILAFLADAATHPTQVAQDTYDVTAGLVSDVVAAVESVA